MFTAEREWWIQPNNIAGVGLFVPSVLKKTVKMEEGERRDKCILD
jgi:hypothetical protein